MIVCIVTEWGYIMYFTNIIIILWPFCCAIEGFFYYIYHQMFVITCYEAMSCIVPLLYNTNIGLVHSPTLCFVLYCCYCHVFCVKCDINCASCSHTIYYTNKPTIQFLLDPAHLLCTFICHWIRPSLIYSLFPITTHINFESYVHYFIKRQW